MWLNQRHQNRGEILRCVVYTSSDSGDQRGRMMNSNYRWCSCRFQNEIVAEEEILQLLSPKQREFTDPFGQNLSLGQEDPQEDGIFLFFKNTGVGFYARRKAWQPTLVFLPGESSWTELGRPQSTGLQRIRHDKWLSIQAQFQLYGPLGYWLLHDKKETTDMYLTLSLFMHLNG